jgi:hypothetical protein
MNRKYIMSAAAAMVLGAVACADMPTMSPDDALMKRGQGQGATQGGETGQKHNGPTWVMGGFELTINGSTGAIPAGQNMHPQNKGECRDVNGVINPTSTENTVWYEAGKKETDTGAKFCAGRTGDSAPVVLQCSISGIPATYAAAGNMPGSGNETLNFLTDDEGEVEDLFVRYRANGAATTGKGELGFSFICGESVEGEGTLDLGQWSQADNAFLNGLTADTRRLEVSGKTVSLTDTQGTVDFGSLYWTFRSRVGS